MYHGVHEPPRNKSKRRALIALTAALAIAGAAFVMRPASTPAADPSVLSVRDECAQALTYPSRSSTDKTWLRNCVHALTPPSIAPSPSGTPSPSPSPSSSPTPTMTTPPPTTPPATTPPPTTPPPSSTPPPSPSPSPTPTPTGPQTGCITQPSACGWPDASNTGAHGALTSVQGDVTLSTAGQVYADMDVHGCITVTAPGVTISNVRVTCPTQNAYGIEYQGQGGGTLLVQDTTILCSLGDTGIGDQHYVAVRIDVSGCDNGWAIYHGNVTIQDSYCHGLTDESVHPEAHTDCIEGTQIADVTIRHNTLLAPHFGTSAIGGCCTGGLVDPPRVRWTVDSNLLDGGSYSIYCAQFPQVGSVISNNRFGRNQQFGPAASTDCVSPDLSWTGNVWDATGLPVAAA